MINVLLIVGMHRSGTSVTTNWLSECGLNIGDKLVKGDSSNKKGHFEDWDFLDLHQKILNYYNYNDRGLIGNIDIQLNEYWKKQIAKLITEKKVKNNQWGFKDPRVCLFLDTYRKFIPEAKYIVLYRDYNEVVESLFLRETEVDKSNMNLSRKIVFHLRSKFLNYEKSEKDRLLKITNIYNINILKLLESAPSNDVLVLKNGDLLDFDKMVYHQLLTWNFKLNFKSFKSVFKQELMKDNVKLKGLDTKIEKEAIYLKEEILKYRMIR